MPNQKRRRWTAEEKLNIIEEARQTSQTISEVCRRHGIAPGQFYGWEKQARNGALIALRAKRAGRKRANRETELETEVTRLRAVVAELSAENLELKKGRWP
jgi:transposase